MKVFELMEKLSKLPAGAEVEVSNCKTLKEFTKCEIVDNIDSEDLYDIRGKVSQVEPGDDKYVYLYFE